ncbi:hypothetical protein OE88DRAFT_1046415 [Heliocybe sulcata]|uniref:Uncharacterized protein n=1 Tax=Heliocybe sulcata TaxID=5364 RepID=A0A5C3MNC0_9AGAM|nr:hypothetical protein OE88DRAFT_1046415 [Heliocybe sulcata]
MSVEVRITSRTKSRVRYARRAIKPQPAGAPGRSSTGKRKGYNLKSEMLLDGDDAMYNYLYQTARDFATRFLDKTKTYKQQLTDRKLEVLVALAKEEAYFKRYEGNWAAEAMLIVHRHNKATAWKKTEKLKAGGVQKRKHIQDDDVDEVIQASSREGEKTMAARKKDKRNVPSVSI